MATTLNIGDFFTGDTWIISFQALDSDGEPIAEISAITWTLQRHGQTVLAYSLIDGVEISDAETQSGYVIVPSEATEDLSPVVYRYFLTVTTSENEIQTIATGTITPKIRV